MLSLNSIKTTEVLRYLGMTNDNADKNTIALIKECEQLLLKAITPRYLMNCFSIEIENKVALLNTSMTLDGQAIKEHLKSCDKAVLFCVTLSAEVDRLIRQMQITDLTKGLILDCCANTAVELLCDQVEQQAIKEYHLNPQFLTTRFSPGYGDLPISVQGEFLSLLDAPRKIGLHASQNHILTPRKSVTAIIGISDKKQIKSTQTCNTCNMQKTCQYRLRGEHCELSNTSKK